MNQQEAIEAAKKFPGAKWVSMDRNGMWWAFDAKPDCRDGRWDSDEANFSAILNDHERTPYLLSVAEVVR